MRSAYVPEFGGYRDCPVYDRYRLAVGATVTGPALIEEPESTCVLGSNDYGAVNEHLDLVVSLETSAGGQP